MRRLLIPILVAGVLAAPGVAQAKVPDPSARQYCDSARLRLAIGRELLVAEWRKLGFTFLGYRCRVCSATWVNEIRRVRALRTVTVRDWRGAQTVRKGKRVSMLETTEWRRGKWRVVDRTWWDAI